MSGTELLVPLVPSLVNWCRQRFADLHEGRRTLLIKMGIPPYHQRRRQYLREGGLLWIFGMVMVGMSQLVMLYPVPPSHMPLDSAPAVPADAGWWLVEVSGFLVLFGLPGLMLRTLYLSAKPERLVKAVEQMSQNVEKLRRPV